MKNPVWRVENTPLASRCQLARDQVPLMTKPDKHTPGEMDRLQVQHICKFDILSAHYQYVDKTLKILKPHTNIFDRELG